MLHFPVCTYSSPQKITPSLTIIIIDNYNSCSWALSLNSMFSLNINSNNDDYKQLLDEVFVISGIIKVEVSVAEADNTNRDLDYSGYHKNRI